jgi:hypothetical protein
VVVPDAEFRPVGCGCSVVTGEAAMAATFGSGVAMIAMPPVCEGGLVTARLWLAGASGGGGFGDESNAGHCGKRDAAPESTHLNEARFAGGFCCCWS